MIPRPVDNPVWVREMRQAARLARTPIILAAVTAIAGLLVCAVGGVASATVAPAEVGVVLFHTFFSIAFAIVAWIGPGVAALTIASERAGRTWEAVVLTGMAPRAVARGKFLASLTYVGLYLVALAPVGALPFLFGGVTATEVLAAFAVLALFAVLAVGFGLAVSSGAPSPAMALLVTLPLAVGFSLFTYFGLGIGASVAAHELWPGVSSGAPVWLPTAYVRADFGYEYLLYLVLLPLGFTAILGSFFYEVTVANLADASDDRSSGIKRWFIGALTGLTILGVLPPLIVPSERWIFTLVALGLSALLALFTLFVLSSDPPGPSRRVLSAWERENAGSLVRFLGPGMPGTVLLLVLAATASQLLLTGAGIAAELVAGGTRDHAAAIAVFMGYAICFFAFLAGFAAFTRAREMTRLRPRALLALALFAAVAGPLFVVAIGGVSGSFTVGSSWVAAPSPLYAFAVIADLGRSGDHSKLVAGAVAMMLWATLGAALGVIGSGRLRRTAAAERAAWTAFDERLRREDTPEAGSPAA